MSPDTHFLTYKNTIGFQHVMFGTLNINWHYITSVMSGVPLQACGWIVLLYPHISSDCVPQGFLLCVLQVCKPMLMYLLFLSVQNL